MTDKLLEMAYTELRHLKQRTQTIEAFIEGFIASTGAGLPNYPTASVIRDHGRQVFNDVPQPAVAVIKSLLAAGYTIKPTNVYFALRKCPDFKNLGNKLGWIKVS